MRQRFLRQTLGLPAFAQVASKHLSYIHVREASALRSISPRSILDIRSLAVRDRLCTMPQRHPVAATPPESEQVTDYDRAHLTTYLQLIDADALRID